jgi:mRNA interferase RelE/StbE
MTNRYDVGFTGAALKQIEKLPLRVRQRIIGSIEKLSEEPRPPTAGKLSGHEDIYRIRVGDYRVVYEIEDEGLVVLVLRVAHRKDAYRGI